MSTRKIDKKALILCDFLDYCQGNCWNLGSISWVSISSTHIGVGLCLPCGSTYAIITFLPRLFAFIKIVLVFYVLYNGCFANEGLKVPWEDHED